jgi:hypothetical protein
MQCMHYAIMVIIAINVVVMLHSWMTMWYVVQQKKTKN